MMSDNQSPSPIFQPLVLEGFSGLNTLAKRPGIKDTEMSWCNGFMPIGDSNLRTIPDVGAAIFTSSGTTIKWMGFSNVGALPYLVTVQSDGSVWRTRTDTLASAQVAGPGTITALQISQIGLSQFAGAYMILVAGQPNGYFFIDPNFFYGPGTLAPGVTLNNGGSGYTSPTASASGGSGTGATFSVASSGGSITSITMTNPGSGYVSGDTPSIVFTGGGTGASASIAIMPFGIGATAVETYQSRVWLVDGPLVLFTAPESTIDFSTANGGGSFKSNDSFLRVSYIQPLQTNGFLYLIADSSINYIAGVSTSGSPPTTTFTNQNADPEVGTPYAATVDVLGSNIIFANGFGIHVSYGGRVTKVSSPLDGFYNSVPNNFGGFPLSACKSVLYGKRIWCALVPVVDPYTNLQPNLLLCWDEKKWWTTAQSISMQMVAHQEISSIITGYACDATKVYPLFVNPSTAFQKVVQSKLWAQPGGYNVLKSSNRLWLVGQYADAPDPSPTITFSVENEAGYTQFALTPTITSSSAFYVAPPTATGQTGYLLGMTISTSAEDFTLISAEIDAIPVGYAG